MDTKNTSTPPTPQEEKELEIYGVAYALWVEWENEMKDKKQPDHEARAVKHFAKMYGVSEKSPLAIMFTGFINGLGYGLELAERMRSKA